MKRNSFWIQIVPVLIAVITVGSLLVIGKGRVMEAFLDLVVVPHTKSETAFPLNDERLATAIKKVVEWNLPEEKSFMEVFEIQYEWLVDGYQRAEGQSDEKYMADFDAMKLKFVDQVTRQAPQLRSADPDAVGNIIGLIRWLNENYSNQENRDVQMERLVNYSLLDGDKFSWDQNLALGLSFDDPRARDFLFENACRKCNPAQQELPVCILGMYRYVVSSIVQQLESFDDVMRLISAKRHSAIFDTFQADEQANDEAGQIEEFILQKPAPWFTVEKFLENADSFDSRYRNRLVAFLIKKATDEDMPKLFNLLYGRNGLNVDPNDFFFPEAKAFQEVFEFLLKNKNTIWKLESFLDQIGGSYTREKDEKREFIMYTLIFWRNISDLPRLSDAVCSWKWDSSQKEELEDAFIKKLAPRWCEISVEGRIVFQRTLSPEGQNVLLGTLVGKQCR